MRSALPKKIKIRGEIRAFLDNVRLRSKSDPTGAMLQLARLNDKIDLALKKITVTEFNLSQQDPHRSILRLEMDAKAFAQGKR